MVKIRNLKHKLAAGAVSAAMLGATMAPAVFADQVQVSNNGPHSKNIVVVHESCASHLSQTNLTNVGVSVKAGANTGGNTVSFNTGSHSGILTGDATTTSTVSVLGGSNVADAPDCCDCLNDTDNDTIKGNGPFSWNKIYRSERSKTSLKQTNRTHVGVYQNLWSNTGKNYVKFNTGKNSLHEVVSGHASTTSDVSVVANQNTAN